MIEELTYANGHARQITSGFIGFIIIVPCSDSPSQCPHQGQYTQAYGTRIRKLHENAENVEKEQHGNELRKHDILRDWYAVGRGRDEAIRKQPFRKCTIEAGQNENCTAVGKDYTYLLKR